MLDGWVFIFSAFLKSTYRFVTRVAFKSICLNYSIPDHKVWSDDDTDVVNF